MISYIPSDLLVEEKYVDYDFIITPMNIYNNFDSYWGNILIHIFPEIRKIVLESGRNLYGNKKQLGTVCYTSLTEPYKRNVKPTNVIVCTFLKGFNFRPDIKDRDEYDYEALEICLDKIKIIFGGNGYKFCLPQYNKMKNFKSCNWEKVEALLEKYLGDEHVDVFYCNHQINYRIISSFRKALKSGKFVYDEKY